MPLIARAGERIMTNLTSGKVVAIDARDMGGRLGEQRRPYWPIEPINLEITSRKPPNRGAEAPPDATYICYTSCATHADLQSSARLRRR